MEWNADPWADGETQNVEFTSQPSKHSESANIQEHVTSIENSPSEVYCIFVNLD